MTPQAIEWLWPETPIAIGVIVLVALILHTVIVRAIRKLTSAAIARADQRRTTALTKAERLLAHAAGLAGERQAARTKTLGSLLSSVADTVIMTIAVLMILSTLNIDLAPLLASAGIGGIALAFGAQSLVKDYLSGMFMIFEDQYGVGDLVNLGAVTGTVEEVGLRITRVRDATGQVWYVRNGEIINVGNQTQGWSTANVDIPVASDEDPARAISLLTEVADALYADQKWADDLIEPPKVAGVNSLTPQTMTLRVILKCLPNKQWGVQRELLERAVVAFNDAGVRSPSHLFPQTPANGPAPLS